MSFETEIDGLATSAIILDGTIVNADVNASAAIVLSKLSTASDQKLSVGAANTTNQANGDIHTEGGSLILKEITTPTADSGYGKLYTKSDNMPYFQDGSGDEHAVQVSGVSVAQYGEMYLNANSTATTIETVNTPHAVRYMTTGALNGFTFDAGSTGSITAFSDGTGKVNVADTGHGLVTGDFITIRGTTNYNGVWTVTRIDDDNFSIPDTWVADDGASDWEQASYLQYTAGTSVVFTVQWSMSSTKGAGSTATATYSPYVNSTIDSPGIVQREFTGTDVGAFGGQAIVTLSAGDRIYLVMESDNTNDITNNYGSVQVRQQ